MNYLAPIGAALALALLGVSSSCELLGLSDGSDMPFGMSEVTINTGDAVLASTYFPLEVGLTWTYELVDPRSTEEGFPFASSFKVRVDRVESIDGLEYFVVNNYFMPTVSTVPDPRGSYPADAMGEPLLLRFSEERVYVRIDSVDQVLYSFVGDQSNWQIEMFKGEIPWTARASATVVGDDLVAIGIDAIFDGERVSPPLSTGFGDLFAVGMGRTRIAWAAQVGYGVWDLKEISIP